MSLNKRIIGANSDIITVIVTPHIAGATKEAIKRMDVELANSIREYLGEC